MVGVSDDRIRLSLFPLSLGGNANDWLHSFAEGTFRNWDALAKQFVTRFFPQTKIHQGKLEISSFKQGMEETLGQALDRFKGLLRKTPVHGFDKTAYLLAFLGGLNTQSKMMLDASAGGSINRKTEDEAYDLIEDMALNEASQSERGAQKGGILHLPANDAMAAQNHLLNQKLDKLTKVLSELPSG